MTEYERGAWKAITVMQEIMGPSDYTYGITDGIVARLGFERKPMRMSADVTVELNEIIDNDLEGFLDLILERAGEPLGMDVSYYVKGVDGSTLTITVEYDEPD